MALDPLILSRLQFAWVIAWHILLPALTVGLASYIALLEGIWFVTGREIYFRVSGFWTRIFAVAFGMGVVSGVVMPFQFGTNWSRFSDATANIISPMLAYEGLTAFTLEAGFLGVLLFGRHLVPRWAHFSAALLVALGTLFSTFWILVTNSWMQTPGGYKLVDGIFYPTSWSQIIFSASFPFRFMHTVVAFYVTTGFVVAGVAAYLLARGKAREEGRIMLSMTLWLLTLLVPLQIFLGDLQGLNTLHYQPAKLAAIEAHWNRETRAPLALFAIPDQGSETNHYAVEVPLLGSLILTHDINGVVPGLKDYPRADRAPVAIPFFAFRVMVGIGLVMLALVAAGLWLRLRRNLYDTVWFSRALMAASPLGFIAVVAGWTTTEVGRQPWTVYGVMRTAHSVTPSLTGMDVLLSLLAYVAVYAVMFPTGLWFVARIVRGGIVSHEASPVEAGRPAAPVKPIPG
ncbi:MAG TPA: cytochrome ubiquinol oxidase subunit I, partial [Rhizomicrobium sp.]|nr:cytochrome ubiquinol oxidase subunit I [Rhizomicrobium sp.]